MFDLTRISRKTILVCSCAIALLLSGVVNTLKATEQISALKQGSVNGIAVIVKKRLMPNDFYLVHHSIGITG